MLMSSLNVNYEDLPSVEQGLTFKSLEKFFADSMLTLSEANYKTLGIFDEKKRYTNLAFVLSDQSSYSVKVGVFSDEDEFNFLARKEYSGPVCDVLIDTLKYLDLSNNIRSKIVDYRREEKYDYNPDIIREGLLNAIIHRDYSFSGSIMVNVYKNRIEIISLDGLVNGLNDSDIGTGISQSRNPKLANIFFRLKYVEIYGTGIRKVKKDYENYPITDLVSVTSNTFKLVLWNKNHYEKDTIGSVRESQEVYRVLSSEEDRILELFALNDNVTRTEVQVQLNVGQTKAGLLLKELANKGYIVRKGKGKNTSYFKA